MPKIVYVLVNEAMEGLVKIGSTEKTLRDRLRELRTTGVPFPFTCKHAVEIPDEDTKEYEKLLHGTFSSHRVNPKREFFEVSFESVTVAMKMIPGKDVTPKDESETIEDEQERRSVAAHSERKQRTPFNFRFVGISDGEELTFSRDDTITAAVCGDRHIFFRGEKTSLSKETREIMRERGGGGMGYPGPDYWKYNGEILSDMRRRIELQNSDDDIE